MKFILRSTDEYDRLVKFFVDILKCWKISQAEGDDLKHIKTDNRDGKDFIAAGCVLAMREGKYIIDGIAVDPAMRKFGLGRLLINKAKEEVLARGGDALYLVARAPEFFRRLGFETIPADNAPNFFECKYCPQYGKECHPEIMKLDLK